MNTHKRIHLSLARMCGEEQRYIQEAFDTNWVAPMGANVEGFEESLEHFLMENGKWEMENESVFNSQFSIFNSSKRVVALSSGTAAIHLGLLLLGVGAGDEVVCQSFTFAASANPIRYLGATPVFVDSEEETWNMCPELLREAIEDRIRVTGRKPKAIIAVHLYGMPYQVDKISKIAQDYNIPVLEDAAEALGSSYRGRQCGTFGEFAAFSFNGNKIITTSGGGALVCPSREMAGKALYYATQARECEVHYEHKAIGYNYRMSNICAGIGLGQMTAIDRFIKRRREIHHLYKTKLSGIPGIHVHSNPSGEYGSNCWLTTVLISRFQDLPKGELRFRLQDCKIARLSPLERGQGVCDERSEPSLNIGILELFAAANIEVRPLWKPLHLQPVFREFPFYGNGVSEALFHRGLCLPSGAGLTDEEVGKVIQMIADCRLQI